MIGAVTIFEIEIEIVIFPQIEQKGIHDFPHFRVWYWTISVDLRPMQNSVFNVGIVLDLGPISKSRSKLNKSSDF